MSYKSIDGLMRHLRQNGIKISGSKQKRQLMNTGYFHGYKGYRFYKVSDRKIPFASYDEIYATIQYDSKLKALFYDKVMFIETAVKNLSLECILDAAHSENIQEIFDKVISGYKTAPAEASDTQKQKMQEKKLRLQNMVQQYLYNAYRGKNPKITHFYNNINRPDVPFWALIEIMTLGDFAFMLESLTIETREKISRKLGIELKTDTYRELIYKYLYSLKDLRNAIAHNAVIFDTRFNKNPTTPAMESTLRSAFGLPYINFKTIGDYLILTCYFMKLLKVSKKEMSAFIREFEKVTEEYKKSVNPAIAKIVIHPDLKYRLKILKNSI